MKPPQILELEKHLGFKLTEAENVEDILSHRKSKSYLFNDRQEIIGLNLYECNLMDISPLGSLVNLTSLDLRNNKISNISSLTFLGNLRSLDLRNNKISNISLLTSLSNLTSLYLGSNPIINISFLASLNTLKILDLRNNQITDISFLTSLSNLTNLYLSSNQIFNISFDDCLNKLEILNLRNNKIFDVYFSRSLSNLKNLDLSSNEILDISFLLGLTNLTSLDLSDNQISDISFLQGLTNLKSLDLRNNQISDIFFLQELTNLTNLNLSDNQITDISFLQGLTNLRSLDLRNNQITNIPLNFINNFPKLKELELQGNPIKNIPHEIFDKYENVLEPVRNYFLELEKGTIINEKAKLIIVGNGRVGKTSLLKKLQGLAYNPDEKYTHGIQIGKLEKEHLQEVKTENLNVNVWDFGGQEIFYATHQFFLTDDAVYILAWTKEENVKAYREKDKETLPTDEKWQSIDYWLDTIRRHAPKSPILVVQTHTDCGREKINEQDFAEFEISNFFNFSASKGFGLAEIQTELTNEINSLPMYGQEFPKTYENVILQIENRKNSGENWLSYHDFVNTICRNANITEGGENTLLDYLDKTGLVVHYPQNPKLKDFIYINPDWLTKQVYSLINNKLEDSGKITKEYLNENLPDYEEFGLLELFQKFGLLFESKDENETFWIAPQYLPATLQGDKYKFFKKQLNKSKLALVFRFSRFMPDNVMINFLSRYGSFAEDIYWKNGIYFTKNETDCIVLLENEKNLHILIDKNQENTVLLKELVEAFSEFGKNAKTEISLNNQDFVSFQELKNDYEKGFKEIKSLQGNRLQIKNFSFLFAQQTPNPMKEELNQIKKLIVEPNKNTILDALSNFIAKYKLTEAESELLNLQSDYKIFQRDQLRGVLSTQESDQKNAKISVRILDLIEYLGKTIF